MEYGEWTTIKALRKGAIFIDEDGIRAVKSEYHLADRRCECILLASGEFAYFPKGDATKVREIILPE